MPARPETPRRNLLLAGVSALGLLPWAGTTSAWARKSSDGGGAAGFVGQLAGLGLIDQEGKRLLPQRLAQQIVLTHFIFTACSTVCPVQVRALAEFQRQLPPALRQKVHLLSVSLDPLSDTPATLRAYALRMGVDFKGWTLATGRPEAVEKLADALALFRPGPDTRRPDDHSTALWLADTHGQLRMRYAGNPPDVPRLLREVAALAAMPAGPG